MKFTRRHFWKFGTRNELFPLIAAQYLASVSIFSPFFSSLSLSICFVFGISERNLHPTKPTTPSFFFSALYCVNALLLFLLFLILVSLKSDLFVTNRTSILYTPLWLAISLYVYIHLSSGNVRYLNKRR